MIQGDVVSAATVAERNIHVQKNMAYDADGNEPGNYICDGTDNLDDIALYARTTDLRSSTVGKKINEVALEGNQNLSLYSA